MLRLIHFFSYCVFGFLIVPLAVTIPLSFNEGRFFVYPLQGFSFRWYADLIEDPTWYAATKHSLIVAVGTTLLATTLGTLAAIGLSRTGRIVAGAATMLFVLPTMVPSVIVAVALFFAFAAIGLAGTFTGLILAHTVLALPFVVVTVSGALRNYDHQLTRAASGLGASPLRVMLTVTLPLIAPGVLSGAIFAFGISFDELVVALFLSSPDTITLPRQLFSGVNEAITPAVVAVSTLLVAVSVIMILLLNLLQRVSAQLTSSSAEANQM